jgi:hypothetical protein
MLFWEYMISSLVELRDGGSDRASRFVRSGLRIWPKRSRDDKTLWCIPDKVKRTTSDKSKSGHRPLPQDKDITGCDDPDLRDDVGIIVGIASFPSLN